MTILATQLTKAESVPREMTHLREGCAEGLTPFTKPRKQLKEVDLLEYEFQEGAGFGRVYEGDMCQSDQAC